MLVTGGSGFIGRHSLPLLLKAGHEVHAVSSKKRTLMLMELIGIKPILKTTLKLKDFSLTFVQPIYYTLRDALNLGVSGTTQRIISGSKLVLNY